MIEEETELRAAGAAGGEAEAFSDVIGLLRSRSDGAMVLLRDARPLPCSTGAVAPNVVVSVRPREGLRGTKSIREALSLRRRRSKRRMPEVDRSLQRRLRTRRRTRHPQSGSNGVFDRPVLAMVDEYTGRRGLQRTLEVHRQDGS